MMSLDDQEQMEYLQAWRKSKWTVKVYKLSPPWEGCRQYAESRYFSHEITARIYAAWLRIWYPKEQVQVEKEQ